MFDNPTKHHHAKSLLPADPALRVKAIETMLFDKGLVDPAALDAIIDLYSHEIGPQIGAGIVAKAWTDDAFHAALLADADLFVYGTTRATNAIVERMTADITATGASLLLAGDLGCLMNMAGKLKREGSPVEVRHVAEVLAGMTDTPPIAGKG